MKNILLVDFGNSRIKWAGYDGKQLQPGKALPHREQSLPELLTQSWRELPRPQRVVVASVVSPGLRQQLAEWVQQHWMQSPEYISSPAQGQGLTNAYTEPARLGCDRWAAMVAAYQSVHAAICVLDCGSAVTLDVVDETGQHLGGLILPGLHTMHASLVQRTSLAPIDFSLVPHLLLGTNTEEAIACGITRSIASLAQQTLFELERTSGLKPMCFLTGGDAAMIAPWLAKTCEIKPDLVLEGLARIADDT